MKAVNLITAVEFNMDQDNQAAEEDLDEMISNVKKYTKELFPFDSDKMVMKKMRDSITERLIMLKDGRFQKESDLASEEIPFFELQGLTELAQGGQAVVRKT
jgi:hypothetical protein